MPGDPKKDDPPVTFIHLSDIHFKVWSGDRYDEDNDLRNELLLDVENVAKDLGTPDGILICGDVAFKGDKDEYVKTKEWLTNLCDKVGCTLANVWCVPGNHDVDRPEIDNSPILKNIHEKLRRVGSADLDAEIRTYMNDSLARELVFRPIREYNRFAGSIKCQISADKPTWQDDFVLNDGSVLRIHGLNSTLVSDSIDDECKEVVLGRFQVPQRASGITHMVMCHHPPEWWRDLDTVESDLDTRVRIELFGHKHSQRLQHIDNTVRLTAGAVHPDRREPGWKPRFNWLSAFVSGVDDHRRLNIHIYPRVWSETEPKFIPDINSCDGADHRPLSLQLEAWRPDDSGGAAQKDSKEISINIEGSRSASTTGERTMDSARILTYRFFDLPHIVRLDIARQLKLLKDEDEGLQDFELFDRIFARALEEEGALARLWEVVEDRHGDNKYPFNPFETQ